MAGVKQRVLFVCVGNACRSQMAEGFARTYGADVMEPASAGLAPATAVPDITREVMREKGVELAGHFPKPLIAADLGRNHLVLNLSGAALPPAANIRDWKVDDPVGQGIYVHRRVRDEVERLVMALILELRKAQLAPPEPGAGTWKRTHPRMLR